MSFLSQCCRDNVLRRQLKPPSVPLVEFTVASAIEAHHQVELRNHHYDLSAISTRAVSAEHAIAHAQVVDVPTVPVFMIRLEICLRIKCGVGNGRLSHPCLAHHAAAVPDPA